MEGEWVDRVNGLKGTKAEVAMVQAPNGGLIIISGSNALGRFQTTVWQNNSDNNEFVRLNPLYVSDLSTNLCDKYQKMNRGLEPKFSFSFKNYRKFKEIENIAASNYIGAEERLYFEPLLIFIIKLTKTYLVENK